MRLAASAAQAQGSGDRTAGEQVFRKCQACHSLEPARRTVGPHLKGVIGRTAGTVEGYDYSVAMKRSGVVWSPDVLDKFLTSPSHFVHGTKMIFTGLRLGLAMGFIGIVIAELLITPTGVGDLISYNSSVADYPKMFATIASIVAVAAISLYLLERLERRLFP